MALSSIGSILDASHIATRSEAGVTAHRRGSKTGEFGDVLTSALHGMTTSSPTSPSSATISTSSSRPASTLVPFMPTSVADIAVFRNLLQVTPT